MMTEFGQYGTIIDLSVERRQVALWAFMARSLLAFLLYDENI